MRVYTKEQLQTEKAIISDELYERKLRTNFEYFLSENGFAEFREMYQKLSQKAWDYGWNNVKVKDYL